MEKSKEKIENWRNDESSGETFIRQKKKKAGSNDRGTQLELNAFYTKICSFFFSLGETRGELWQNKIYLSGKLKSSFFRLLMDAKLILHRILMMIDDEVVPKFWGRWRIIINIIVPSSSSSSSSSHRQRFIVFSFFFWACYSFLPFLFNILFPFVHNSFVEYLFPSSISPTSSSDTQYVSYTHAWMFRLNRSVVVNFVLSPSLVHLIWNHCLLSPFFFFHFYTTTHKYHVSYIAAHFHIELS